MTPLTIYILLAIILILLVSSILLFRELSIQRKAAGDKILLESRATHHEEEIRRLTSERDLLAAQLDENRTRTASLREANARLEVDLQHSLKQIQLRDKEAEELKEKLIKEFYLIAEKVIEEKSAKVTEGQTRTLRQVLDPLNTRIEDFKKRFEESFLSETKERHTLTAVIQQLRDQSVQLSKDATNLSEALRGQSKVQGDWGESLLQRILEESGLTSPEQYELQEYIRDSAGNILTNAESGKRMRPDVIVHMPGGRDIVIDAKVSLTDYARYTEAQDPESAKRHMLNHIRSVKRHVDELSSREYERHLTTSPEFVLLFIPMEGACSLAMQNDKSLWIEAYRKKVIISGPTNIIGMLMIISDLWVRDSQRKNIELIVSEATKMYEKFVRFAEDFEKVGSQLTMVTDTYEKSRKHLTTGRGNLVGRIVKMKDMGISSPKRVASTLLSDTEMPDALESSTEDTDTEE